MDLVSVIIPTYNRASTICSAINSVLDQTYLNIEIIVIDDGSTDNTREILSKYGEKIKYYYKENGGVSSARNYGVSVSTGDYISFLDSDDQYSDDNIYKKINSLTENSEYDMVISDCRFINETGCLLFQTDRRSQYPYDGDIFNFVLKNPWLIPSSLLVTKYSFSAIGGFDESLMTAEDLDFFIKYSKMFKVKLIDEVLVNCLKEHNGLSDLDQTYDDYVYIYERFFESYSGENVLKFASNIFFEVYLRAAKGKLWKKKYLESSIYLFKAIKNIYNFRCIIESVKFFLKIVYFYIMNLFKN